MVVIPLHRAIHAAFVPLAQYPCPPHGATMGAALRKFCNGVRFRYVFS